MTFEPSDRRIEDLEQQVKYLTETVENLLFRLEDLGEVVRSMSDGNKHDEEVFNHIRHVVDKARVAGLRDNAR